MDKIKIDSDSAVLDVGCGTGTLAIPLAKKTKSVTALDFSKALSKMNQAARRHVYVISWTHKNIFSTFAEGVYRAVSREFKTGPD